MAILEWFYANTLGNIVASVMTGVALWFWKIRKHVRVTQEIHAKLHERE